jgi:RNA polymerase sigma factor (sigma-70 family)
MAGKAVDGGLFIKACSEGGRAMNTVLTSISHEHRGVLMRFGRRSLPEQDRKDVFQETLIKAWDRCSQFDGSGELLHWLHTIYRHAVLDHLRKVKPEESLTDSEGQFTTEIERSMQMMSRDFDWDPLAQAQSREAIALFETCFERFTEKHPQAATIMEWIVDEDPQIEVIALALGRTRGATREYVSQCRKKFRVFLAPWYALVSSKSKVAA